VVVRDIQGGHQLKQTIAYQMYKSCLLESRVVVLDDTVRGVFVCELARVQSLVVESAPTGPGIDPEGAVDVEGVVECNRLAVGRPGLIAVDLLDGDASLPVVETVQGVDKEEEYVFAVRQELVMTTVRPRKMLSAHEDDLALVQVSETCVRPELFPCIG
jgi:hypothetical protein